jgi:hypothetical protein
MRMPTMFRPILVALTLLVGCGQDIDLGSTQTTGPATGVAPKPTPTSLGRAPEVPLCPFEDPALLQAPANCPTPYGDPLYAVVCVVTADGRTLDPFGDHLLRLPACPTGVYFTMSGPLPPVDNIERSVVVLKGDENDKPSFDASMAPAVPRTIEALPARASFFVRFDPRPSDGLRVNVVTRHAELFAGRDLGARSAIYGHVVGFLVGDKPVP